MKKHGKKFRNKMDSLEIGKAYPLEEAIKILGELSYAQFDESVDLSLRLGVDPKHSDQVVRGACNMPNGTGKKVRVIVFAKGEKVTEAEKAGADVVGGDDLIEKVKGGWMDFDSAVSTPDMMGTVSKIGKILGPKGLMPNPKAGTVTFEVEKAVKDIKSGRVEFRCDKSGIIHASIGKVSFGHEKLKENLVALLEMIQRMKPSGAKGKYFKSMFLSSTMSPSVCVDVSVYEQGA